jgi:alpha-galactosidase
VRLDGRRITLLFELGRTSRLLYIGDRLPDELDLAAIASLTRPGARESQPDEDPGLGLLSQAGGGFQGEPALVAEGPEGEPIELKLVDWSAGDDFLELGFLDPLRCAKAQISWKLLPSDIVSVRAGIVNEGDEPLRLHWLAAAMLPLPGWAGSALQVHGRWGGEFQLARTPLATGKVEKVSRTGRSGFDGAHYLLAADPDVREEAGRVLAAHLAWSGNGRSLIETLPTGERQLQIGEWLAPGEILLASGEHYASPEALIAFSSQGLNGIRRHFHAELRSRRAVDRAGSSPRKVHFNTWEAVYFELDGARLLALAEDAASLGAERFVLDDGWFRGRYDDRRALGDWTADPARLPAGLTPIIQGVKALGMDFGLWIEPEMVSPDSDLYRDRPDWCLHQAGRDRPTQRHQLVLDLTRGEVREHVFAAVSRLLAEHEIAYLKWDHNRDLFPAVSRGRPAAHAQTLGFYELLDRLRREHPRVEIESCASGGARIDFAVAARAARVWPSDNTDAIERVRLHKAMSLFYPPELIGAHFGAAPNPTTGRSLGVSLRARVAMFAHFGIEADPAKLSPVEREELAGHVALYKRFRRLIHAGVQSYADADDPGVTVEIIVAPAGEEAIALIVSTEQAVGSVGRLIRLPGLSMDARYRLTLLNPWPHLAAHHLGETGSWRAGPIVDGATLGKIGIRLPAVHPETAWLVYLERLAR